MASIEVDSPLLWQAAKMMQQGQLQSAIDLLSQAHGSVTALSLLCILKGYQQNPDDDERYALVKKAVSLGCPLGKYLLGRFKLKRGKTWKAVKLYEQSGIELAMNDLACIHMGYFSRNKIRAVSLFKKAALQGQSDACFNMSHADPVNKLFWLEQAAARQEPTRLLDYFIVKPCSVHPNSFTLYCYGHIKALKTLCDYYVHHNNLKRAAYLFHRLAALKSCCNRRCWNERAYKAALQMKGLALQLLPKLRVWLHSDLLSFNLLLCTAKTAALRVLEEEQVKDMLDYALDRNTIGKSKNHLFSHLQLVAT